MADTSYDILERFRTSYGKDIDLTLRPAYHDLLTKLGEPQKHLPPVIHVAGTNGKGSTCAFMRSILESAGYRVHVYTSPHLVRFHERIRIAGKLIDEEELVSILRECEEHAIPHGVSYFEAATAAALVAFARHKADFTLLETGLGGRLDATNIVEKPLANVITRLSFDHREYLGTTIDAIAREKAGIMRTSVPCFIYQQSDPVALQALKDVAKDLGTPLLIAGQDWRIEERKNGFSYKDKERKFDLPIPALLGRHQYQNAALAIATLTHVVPALSQTSIDRGLKEVEWPARLQNLSQTALKRYVPENIQIWLDGGHNDSAGEVLAAQIDLWRHQDGNHPKALYVILGMLTTKEPKEFLAPFMKEITSLHTLGIENEPLSFDAEILAERLRHLGIKAQKKANLEEALKGFSFEKREESRILICGSLYLAGNVLKETSKP